MSTAGKVQKYVIKSINTLGTEVETTLSNKFKINPNAEYSAIDTASKALIALSNDVYSDTSLITDISVNEAKEGGGTVDFDIPEENLLVINSDTNGGSLKCEFPKNGADVSVLGVMKQGNSNELKNSNNAGIILDLNSPNISDISNKINVVVSTGYCGSEYNTRSFNNAASGSLWIRLRFVLTNSQGAIKILENRMFRYSIQ